MWSLGNTMSLRMSIFVLRPVQNDNFVLRRVLTVVIERDIVLPKVSYTRRRRQCVANKSEMLAELAAGFKLSKVAERHDVCQSMLCRWRKKNALINKRRSKWSLHKAKARKNVRVSAKDDSVHKLDKVGKSRSSPDKGPFLGQNWVPR